MRRYTRPLSGLLCGALAVLIVCDAGQAQEAGAENILVARYSVEEGTFANVTTSTDLVNALRAGLTADASMPLNEPLRVHLDGLLADPLTGGSFPFLYSGLAFQVEGGAEVSESVAAAVRSSHGPGTVFDDGDWSEDEAWAWLAETVAEGLTRSLVADGRFGLNGEGAVPLRVAAVHSTTYDDWDTEEGFQRVYLRLQPSAGFASSSDGNWEAPEGFGYDIQVVLIELEPGPASEVEAVELSTEDLERLVGAYDTQRDGSFEIRRDGQTLVGIMERGGETREFPLEPLSETDFVSDVDGRRVQFEFEIGEDARATGVTLQQGGFEMTFPRIP